MSFDPLDGPVPRVRGLEPLRALDPFCFPDPFFFLDPFCPRDPRGRGLPVFRFRDPLGSLEAGSLEFRRCFLEGLFCLCGPRDRCFLEPLCPGLVELLRFMPVGLC